MKNPSQFDFDLFFEQIITTSPYHSSEQWFLQHASIEHLHHHDTSSLFDSCMQAPQFNSEANSGDEKMMGGGSKTTEKGGGEIQVSQECRKEESQVMKSGRWSVREHFQYLDHIQGLVSRNQLLTPHKVLRQLRERMPHRSPRQLREHHRRMVKIYGSLQKMVDCYAPYGLDSSYMALVQKMTEELMFIRSYSQNLDRLTHLEESEIMKIWEEIKQH